MLRVFLIVAVAAGLAAAVVGYTRVGGKIAELNTELTTTKSQRDQLQASDVKLKRDLRTANESLVSTTAELADTKSDLEITQARAASRTAGEPIGTGADHLPGRAERGADGVGGLAGFQPNAGSDSGVDRGESPVGGRERGGFGREPGAGAQAGFAGEPARDV
jgi:hypothetical protein